jgi:hypothetical protein
MIAYSYKYRYNLFLFYVISYVLVWYKYIHYIHILVISLISELMVLTGIIIFSIIMLRPVLDAGQSERRDPESVPKQFTLCFFLNLK